MKESNANEKEKLLRSCMPHFMVNYVDSVTDVRGDGNCGFRSVAVSLGRNEEEWLGIRRELLRELTTREDHYTKYVCGRSKEEYEKLKTSLSFFEAGQGCSQGHYMLMPETGFLIANTYQCRVHVFAKTILRTFLPDNSKLTSNPPISMILLNGDTSFGHYMSIKLKPASPIPPKIYNLDSPGMSTAESLIWDMLVDPLIEKFEELNRLEK